MELERQVEVEAPRVYRVAEGRIEEAREIVAKANKKVARFGLGLYRLVESELIEEEREVRPGVKIVEGHYDVELIGELAKYDGWSFVGVLSYDEEAGVISRLMPGVEADLSSHRVREAECDHCGVRRARNATYLVRHDDGRIFQVGSSCIQGFLGVQVRGLDWLASDAFADLGELDEDSDGGGYGGGRVRRVLVRDAMAEVMAAEKAFGWKSRGSAREYGGDATVDIVLACWFSLSRDRQLEDQRRALEAARGPEAAAKAEAVLAWAVEQDGSSEWAVNLRALAACESVALENLPLLASAVVGYNREVLELAKKAAKVESKWFGEPKQRVDFSGRVVHIAYIDGYAYNSVDEIVIMVSDAGEVAKWKTSYSGLSVGDRVVGKVSVKAHGEYRGEKQTVVLRCKLEVIPEEGEGQEG